MPRTAGIYYVESPTDGRAVFVMPWAGATLVGTTETPYRGDPDQVATIARRGRISVGGRSPLFSGLWLP